MSNRQFKYTGMKKSVRQYGRNRTPIGQMNKVVRTRQTNPQTRYDVRRPTIQEVKCVDVENQTMPIQTGSVATNITVVNAPLEGAAFYQRVGRRIAMKSFHLNGYITQTFSNAAPNLATYVRIMVIYDRQTNGAAPSYADILLAYNASGATSSIVLDGINMNNRDRFTVLMDYKVTLPPIGINGVTASELDTIIDTTKLMVNRFIPLKNLETHFKNSAGGVGDIATGGLFVFALDINGVASNAWQFLWTGRLRYRD
nr:MAG: capsid protein [Cressdnaviricota sp.]